jgi:hypothetical protein
MPFGSPGHSQHSGENGERKLMPHRDAELSRRLVVRGRRSMLRRFLNENVEPWAPYHGRVSWETRSSIVVLTIVGCALALILFY